MFDDFLSLFFPPCCKACNKLLLKHEELICNLCFIELPRFKNSTDIESKLEKMLKGRIQFTKVYSFFTYQKGSRVQHLLHQLKYNNQPEIGILIGKWMANELFKTDNFENSVLVPVPLHPKKLKKRGYNQSSKIAKGISDQLKIPIEESILFRKKFTSTQTKKDKNERWLNVEDVFGINIDLLNKYSKIVLIDDVITTGSTIEACSKIILKHSDADLYIMSVAFAEN
jgi:ComF family protein